MGHLLHWKRFIEVSETLCMGLVVYFCFCRVDYHCGSRFVVMRSILINCKGVKNDGWAGTGCVWS